jgi:hypothetical protein
MGEIRFLAPQQNPEVPIHVFSRFILFFLAVFEYKEEKKC